MRAIFVQIKREMGRAYDPGQEAADQIQEMSEMYSTSDAGEGHTHTLITFNAFARPG